MAGYQISYQHPPRGLRHHPASCNLSSLKAETPVRVRLGAPIKSRTYPTAKFLRNPVATERAAHIGAVSWRPGINAALRSRRCRAGLKLTREEFAARFGFAKSAVKDWEQGRRQPERSARMLLKMIEIEPKAVERASCRSGPSGCGPRQPWPWRCGGLAPCALSEVADRVLTDLAHSVELQLVHDAGAVGFERLDADLQGCGDLRIGDALAD